MVELIKKQEKSLDCYDHASVMSKIATLKTEKEIKLLAKLNDVKKELEGTNTCTRRSLQLAQEKGAGSWLTALPIQSLGYTLNKEEFRDSIRLRYGWQIPNIPSFCVCGKKNDINHTLICKTGGYVILRHNKMRDINGDFLKQVCHDVNIEPELLPIESEEFKVQGINSDKARLDISARGLWGPCQRTMFDVHVFHPNAPTYKDQSINELYALHEKQKISAYQNRVLQVEKASFTPLVYSTNGGMGKQASAFHKRVAQLLSEKTKETYSDIMNCMRTKLSYAMLRSTLVSVRGARGKYAKSYQSPLSSISFNLIPQAQDYEPM